MKIKFYQCTYDSDGNYLWRCDNEKMDKSHHDLHLFTNGLIRSISSRKYGGSTFEEIVEDYLKWHIHDCKCDAHDPEKELNLQRFGDRTMETAIVKMVCDYLPLLIACGWIEVEYIKEDKDEA